MPEDFYALLGVDSDASEAAIRRAYRTKARDQHPDVSDDADAAERFRQLKRAKAVLTDPEERRAYDRLGHERYLSNRSASGEPPEPREDRPARGTPPDSDPLDARSGGLSSRFIDGFPSFAAGWPPSPPAADGIARQHGRPGELDLRSVLRSARSAAPAGNARESDDGSGPDCPKCGGRGSFVHVLDTGRGRRRRTERCERCAGTGTV